MPSQPQNPSNLLLNQLIMEVLQTFFALRAAGQQLGLVTESGAGGWGILRLLHEQGPMTLSDIARLRAVSRQYIQRLAHELVSEGWVEMRANPAHRRAHFIQLTGPGLTKLAEMDARLQALVTRLAPGFDARALQDTLATLAQLREAIAPDAVETPQGVI